MVTQNRCRYSQVIEPCIIKTWTPELCHACLVGKVFAPFVCANCGQNAYEEVKLTGKAHICKAVAK